MLDSLFVINKTQDKCYVQCFTCIFSNSKNLKKMTDSIVIHKLK